MTSRMRVSPYFIVVTTWSLDKEEFTPTKLFFELKEEQRKIMNVGIAEFAEYGYTNSSTNRMVKSSGISKGSLFKYFANKEEFYFFILDTVTSDFTESLQKKTKNLSPKLFQRVMEYSVLEFSWYIQNPEKAKVILEAFRKNDSEIYRKTLERYSIQELDI